MTIKEAILQSLEDLKKIATYMEVHDHIINNNYYDFKDAKTPPATVAIPPIITSNISDLFIFGR
jgi:hypothetical protein